MCSRSSGWVLNIELNRWPLWPFSRSSGVSIHRCDVAWEVRCKTVTSASSFLSARRRPSGLRASSTALASARPSRLREIAAEHARSERCEHQHEQEADDGDDRLGSAAVVVVAAPTATATREGPEVQEAPEQVGDHGDCACGGHGDGHDPDVVVADVGHLVGDDALELGALELVEQARRGGDGCVLGVLPRSERVRGRIVDDEHPRFGEPGGDGHLLHQVVEALELLGVGGFAPVDAMAMRSDAW